MWKMWRFIRYNSTECFNSVNRKDLIAADHRRFYPTIEQLRGSTPILRIPKFVANFKDFDFSESSGRRSPMKFQIEGRVRAIRKSGKGLYFIDVVQDNQKVQIYTSNKLLNVTPDDFANTLSFIRKGDHVICVGHAFRTNKGELSLQASEYVKVASPCLESTSLPDKLRTRKSINRNRVMDYLVDSTSRQRIIIRSQIISSIRQFLGGRGFLEVQTPIISGRGTGANAEPFQTMSRFLPKMKNDDEVASKPEASTEDAEVVQPKPEPTTKDFEVVQHHVASKPGPTTKDAEPLQLRVAPELWLKKLVIAGFDKVFEIGPNFRNEGIDATHNPEFFSCEFYQSFTSLDELMDLTEAILERIYADLMSIQNKQSLLAESLPKLRLLASKKFQRYEFIPTIEQKTGVEFPPLLDVPSLLNYYTKIGVPIPAQRTPAGLLDHLSSTLLESISVSSPDTPIFIFNQPSLMSPLAKSTTKKYGTGLGREYDVSLRFELFINGKEYVNSYEEENSPFDQREKFLLQQKNKTEFGDLESVVPDWNYVQAMEYGLPPTGGWGCGIDRLAMLFSGATRIEDVLTFGTLKDVIRQ